MERIMPGVSLGCDSSVLGTLGFFAGFSNDQRAYAITCSHSLAPKSSGSPPRPNSSMTGQCGVRVPASNFVDGFAGQMIWAATLVPQRVEFDCAVVRMDNVPLPEVFGSVMNDVWQNQGFPNALQLVTVPPTVPLLNSTSVPQPANEQELGLPRRFDGPFIYNNLFAVDYNQPPQEGMSGAPIVDPSTKILVGMHVGGIGNKGFFHRADSILNALQMVLFRT